MSAKRCPICGSEAVYKSETRYPLGKLLGSLLSYNKYGCIDCDWSVRVHASRLEPILSRSVNSKGVLGGNTLDLNMVRKASGEVGFKPIMGYLGNPALNSGPDSGHQGKAYAYTYSEKHEDKAYIYKLVGLLMNGITGDRDPISVSLPEGLAVQFGGFTGHTTAEPKEKPGSPQNEAVHKNSTSQL